MNWYCVIAGRQYGPVDIDVIKGWAREGRLRPEDHVWNPGMTEWAQAGQVDGVFDGGPTGPAAGAPPVQMAAAPQYLPAHRGATILVYGILSIVLCGIFGPFGWSMANRDLRLMRIGQMDPTGEGLTSAGRICSIIGTIFLILGAAWMLLWIGIMFFAVAARGF